MTWKRYERVTVLDEGIETYVAIIIQKSNPQLATIIEQFDSQIALFKDNKPE